MSCWHKHIVYDPLSKGLLPCDTAFGGLVISLTLTLHSKNPLLVTAIQRFRRRSLWLFQRHYLALDADIIISEVRFSDLWRAARGQKKSFPKSGEWKGTQMKPDWVSSCTTMNNQSRTLPSGHKDLTFAEEKQAPFKHKNMHQGLIQSLWSNNEAVLNSVWVKPLMNTVQSALPKHTAPITILVPGQVRELGYDLHRSLNDLWNKWNFPFLNKICWAAHIAISSYGIYRTSSVSGVCMLSLEVQVSIKKVQHF